MSRSNWLVRGKETGVLLLGSLLILMMFGSMGLRAENKQPGHHPVSTDLPVSSVPDLRA